MSEDLKPGTFEYDEEVRKKKRKVIIWNVLPLGFGLSVLWLALFIEWQWGFNLLKLRKAAKPLSADAVYITLGVSVVGIIWMLWRIRTELILVEHGVEVVGRVTSISPLRNVAQCPVRFEYEFEGVRYTGAADVSGDDAAKFKQDAAIVLLVNPKKPKCAVPKKKVV